MSSETPQLPLILDPATLAQHLEDPHLLIIDVPLKAESYQSGHVPGAIFLESRRLLAGTGEVPNDVPSEAALSTLFSELGLTPETHVVAYDDEGGGWAGRLLWTLELIGHRRTRISTVESTPGVPTVSRFPPRPPRPSPASTKRPTSIRRF